MDPFLVFAVFSALTPATNHLAVSSHNAVYQNYLELKVTINLRESRERAKYMAKLLSKTGLREGTPSAGVGLLDDEFRKDAPSKKG